MAFNYQITYRNQKTSHPGNIVLYWMQAAQRNFFNPALEYAISSANENNLPLLVYFAIDENYPHANQRHFSFMFEGLFSLQEIFKKRGIPFIVENVNPVAGVTAISEHASLLIIDDGYLLHQQQWRNEIAKKVACPCIQVTSNVIVNPETVSIKDEWSAATLRRKIQPLVKDFLKPLPSQTLNHKKLPPTIVQTSILESTDKQSLLQKLYIDKSVPMSSSFIGGEQQAMQLFDTFLQDSFHDYHRNRNDPSAHIQSHMSPYLHFGMISPAYLALKVSTIPGESCDAYLEELIVRRELACNFVVFNKNYKSFSSLPTWSQTTLQEHSFDRREYLYDLQALEHAQTHDDYWNAAQLELLKTGKMHNYMRMYWGKKVLEWSGTPQQAYEILCFLNDKYQLDGRDPNSYAGIAWCFGKHDRPWKERSIFGKVRYMNDNGLKRKFKIDKYVRWVETL